MTKQKYDESTIKMIIEYLQNLREGMAVLKQEIEVLRIRVDILERSSKYTQTPSSGLKAPPGLSRPPR